MIKSIILLQARRHNEDAEQQRDGTRRANARDPHESTNA